jgi:hypothetical protein
MRRRPSRQYGVRAKKQSDYFQPKLISIALTPITGLLAIPRAPFKDRLCIPPSSRPAGGITERNV